MKGLHKNKQYIADSTWTVKKAGEELDAGLEILESISGNIVTIFGSHKTMPGDPYYNHCENTARTLGENGFAIITGGGPGIMEAANKGAMVAGVPSVGFKAELLTAEKGMDNIHTHTYAFYFLFTRRFVLSIKSDALIFYPGGYGTLNELFEYLTLIQTGITDMVPIICVGRAYWKGLFDWLEDYPLKKNYFINEARDIDLVTIVDDVEEIINRIVPGNVEGI
ncbi:MAG: TIGR00730 family Rossman fold protein [Candidatus Ryanbacteria bacterium CG10_big_fil_rev_8_21_14_0_10_43_42]|uniref:Cytokinin riboside 5'-monophosphate phosphoribohydrolase n=1 Tax=Candidatus Ryanbacteria bacterium CG10_big_fil_rev_8_21_14_0_10_43_42 TaxID=1974864 RepID=A0A2M8KY32_9BACT|nr:MAG: TIGR00730 family Rossman fold protein [Candidatus Ryanbacteria bacterium CG10_big_fil_rev_8_21_14_0_10_43_42]